MVLQWRLSCVAILVFALASRSAAIVDSCPGDASEDLGVADMRVSLLQESVSVHRVLEAAGQKKAQASTATTDASRDAHHSKDALVAPVRLVESAMLTKETPVPSDVVWVPAAKPCATHHEVAVERVEVVTNQIPNVIWMVIVVLSWLLIVMCFGYCFTSDKRDLEIREVVREVLVPQVQEVPRPVPVPQVQVIEKIVQVPVPQIQQVAVPQIQVVEKAVPQVQVQQRERIQVQQVPVPQVQVPAPYVQQASMVSIPQSQQVAVPQVQVENISPVASTGLGFYRPPSPRSPSRSLSAMTAEYLAPGFPQQVSASPVASGMISTQLPPRL